VEVRWETLMLSTEDLSKWRFADFNYSSLIVVAWGTPSRS
jgi:hypothetical protein